MTREFVSIMFGCLLPAFMILSNIVVICFYARIALKLKATRIWTSFFIFSALLFSLMSICTIIVSMYPLWKSADSRALGLSMLTIQQISGFLGCLSVMLGAYFLMNASLLFKTEN